MKTQISRDGYRQNKRYSGVYQQQGRLITDSDWNELVDTLKERVNETLFDVVGSGSPKGRNIQIQMVSNSPRIIPGSIYADGVAGFVDSVPNVSLPFSLTQQKGFPSAPPAPPAGSTYNIYADLWERPVTSLEDDGLRDPALHGADTCTRMLVMTQIKTCSANLDPRSLPNSGTGLLTLRYPATGGQLGSDPCDPKAQEVDPVGGDFLFRVEVHDVTLPDPESPDLPSRVVVKWSRENGAEQFAFEDVPDWFTTGPWIYELFTVESEQHLGHNIPVLGNQPWAPKRGSLVTVLPQTAPAAGTLVRRWDGYCVFVAQTNGLFAVSTAAGETLNVTAPGASVTFESARHGEITRQVARVSLSDLELLLEIEGAIFVAGDYWSAPVRRETYEAGRELLKESYPSGIFHRYVPLAKVLANNTLEPLSVDAQHRLAFPRLSSLDAEDIKYGTTCTSGLFTPAHDTVEKALDRLCAINGSHVGYTKPSDTSVYRGETPTTVKTALDLLARVTSDDIAYTTTCTSGLFDGTHDTVEKALNRLCAINAGHVGFTKPADTSVFQGSNPTTVAQALNLLQDVKSQQISYTPTSNPNNVNDVKEALDELYARPVQNGSRVYIGQNGQYASIDLAVAALLAQNKKEIALALLPGDHQLPANWNPGNLTDVHLSILGLGGAARLMLNTGSISFTSLASFRLENTNIVFENASLSFNLCREVWLTNNVLEGSHIFDRAMIYLNGHQDVYIRGNVIDTQWETSDANIVSVLGLPSAIESNVLDLFTVGLSNFRVRSRTVSQRLVDSPDRSTIGGGIHARATNNGALTFEEREAYQELGNAIQVSGVETIRSWFERIRQLTYAKNPGTSIVLNPHAGHTTIQNNRITGLIGLLSLPKSGVSLHGVSLGGFYFNFQSGNRYVLSQSRYILRISDNVMAGIRGGETLINNLRSIASGNTLMSATGMFKVLEMTNNIIENEDNLFLAEEINLHGNHFTSQHTPLPQSQGLIGWMIGSSATVNDNRGRLANSVLHSGITAHSSNTMINANFRINVLFVIIG